MTIETPAPRASASSPDADQPPRRIVIQLPAPAVDGGRYPLKRCPGDRVEVSADIFRDGHELMRAVIRATNPGGEVDETELAPVDAHLGGVRWAASFTVDRPGRWEYTVEAWTDVWGTWRDELARKVTGGQADLSGELSEGVLLLRAAAASARSRESARLIEHAAGQLADPGLPAAAKHDVALGEALNAAIEDGPDRHGRVCLEPPIAVEVDRLRARFGAWYEMFPRSWGGLRGVETQIPRLAELGFDVVYLPPIHPIGMTNRKGRDNALVAGPGDPGSPWAIGDASGGHDAIHPELGTFDDLRALTATAQAHNIDIALDFAIQCSADHPWLTEHPEWFHRRPDGTLKYAENPPKKYQDIYNVNFQCDDWKNLWNALRDVVLQWVERGVKVFRVDNPHTKPLAFWEWMIREVRAKHPDTIFLAEAFTRRAVMRALAKSGFNQSYTYFTWQQSRWELEQYMNELAYETADYYRPNFFANTPDILTEQLQHGGRAQFEARLVLAATLSPTYGIYSGYEWIEHTAVKPGSEEYLDSEKYEAKERTLEGAPLLGLIRMLNEARRSHPALQHLSNITFLDTRNDGLIAYIKKTGDDAVLAVVCLDSQWAQEGSVVVPDSLGLPWNFQVQDLLDGSRYDWHVGDNYVRLAPGDRQAHLFRVVNG
jgi:starch synthase (maltosyl-transferring)